MLLFLTITNIPLALYTSTIHQKGTIDVMEHIQAESTKLRNSDDMSVLFLMPCHSTPFYRYCMFQFVQNVVIVLHVDHFYEHPVQI